MPRINCLDSLVVNQIAAGEVIERPGSVVKELLENSIDALATRIEVAAAAGGAELIRVLDNGEGIHPDDLPLAVASHATSKIRRAEDLFNVHTMGFRGEALASIASVSHLQLRSRQAESESGYALEVRGGQLGAVEACGSPVGTLIEIRRLFENTPVRRKFLKSTSTEFGHIAEQFARIALANPRLHLVLKHNDKLVHELPATDSLLDRLSLFCGEELASHLIPVDAERNDTRLWGYVAHPSQSRSSRKGQYLFLNGRYIQDRSLQHALGEGYRGLLLSGRYPVVFLFIEMPANLFDVNVHPTKAEVRFRDSQQLYRLLLSSLRTAFLSQDLDSQLRVPANRGAQAPDTGQQQMLRTELADWARTQLDGWKPLSELDNRDASYALESRQQGAPHFPASGDGPSAPGKESPWSSDDDVAARASEWSTSEDPEQVGTTERWDGLHAAEHGHPSAHSLPSPRTRAMQVHDSYLVVETEHGLTVVDQHALHERILYEELRARILAGSVETQRLLVPEPIEIGSEEKSLLLENADLLKQLGFLLEDFGQNTVLMTGYPAIIRRADLQQLVRDMAERLESPERAPTRRDVLDELMHMMACKGAIKAGQQLAPQEIESLLERRHLIDDAHHCPHGRPTALVLSRAELDRQFGRKS